MEEDRFNKRSGFKTSVFDNIEQWETSRRKFIRAGIVAGAITQFSYLQSCLTDSVEHQVENSHFSALHTQILNEILEILFPDDGNGPGIKDLNTFNHILWVMDDPTEDRSQTNYLKNGIVWTEETTLEEFGVSYQELDQNKKEALIAHIASEKWGKDWLSMLLTYIFESLIIDSIYGVNTNEAGWKWLEHQPGEPRPNQNNEYSKVLEKVQ